MAININTSNYINNQTVSSGNSSNVSGQVSVGADGATLSVKGLNLKPGQTFSGQIVEIDGKDIKLLLSNNQTINAKLDGNINALLGQTLSFEVKGTENGQTALRPLYTNLNNSPAVANALASAGLPQTENYVKMVSSMMDEGMPINKNALYSMAKNVNSFPTANPETVVRLNKLGLQINEITINQYENYKGLERQIIGDVDKLAKGMTDLLKDSLSEIVSGDKSLLQEANTSANTLASSKNLFTSFLNAITGRETSVNSAAVADNSAETVEMAEENLSETEVLEDVSLDTDKGLQDGVKSPFDTARQILDMVENLNSDGSAEDNISDSSLNNTTEGTSAVADGMEQTVSGNRVSGNMMSMTRELAFSLINDRIVTDGELYNKLSDIIKQDNSCGIGDRDLLSLAKDILNLQADSSRELSDGTKQKLAKLLSGDEFGKITRDALTRQILLKPEEAASAKNIDDLYNRIIQQASKAVEIMQNSGRENPELMNAAKNISDNVTFMNELNQVATYVQLPLLMNGKSAHGDLYVYTKKKSLRENDGNISALLHLDMDNLGPMDIYIALNNGKKLNTHFYLSDESAIDLIADNLDYLNKRLTDKGYITEMTITEKTKGKGNTRMAEEFLKDEPGKEGTVAVKYSFDVRA